jgi:hypothetical protein
MGRLTNFGGEVYEGKWLAGKQHGFGKYYYSNGNTYAGSWLNGMRHGKGMLVDSDGKRIFIGQWLNGKQQ